MSKADLYESGDRKWERNDQIKAAADDVLAVHRRGIEGIKFEIDAGLIDDGDTVRDITDEESKARAGRIEKAHTHRYEILDDGSVLEIIAHGDTDTVEVVARPNLVSNPRGFIAGGGDPTLPAEE